MAEKRIDSPARECAVSGKVFEPGDAVCSFLLDDVNSYLRVDMLADKAAAYVAPRLVVCRWKWVVKVRGDNQAREEARTALEQTEAMFLALCDEPASGDDPAVRAVLKYLLALALQRKRILKGIPNKVGFYRHPASGRMVEAPAPDHMDGETLRKAAEKLAAGMRIV
jgi:hypothetical protein